MHKGRKLRTLAAIMIFSLTAGLVTTGATPRMAYADTAITISQTEKSILVGDMFQLKVSGVTDTQATYSWSSSAPAVATVNARGIVTGVTLGTTTIYCRITKSDRTTTTLACNVTVRTRVEATAVAISNANYQLPNAHVMSVGDVYDFNAALTPASSTDKVYWEITDSSYALVDSDGVVAALKPGITRLVAYSGKDENTAKANANRIQSEIYIYITASSTGAVPSSTPTPTAPPYVYGGTPTPIPVPSATPVPASGSAEVESVTMISGNTIQIKFGKPVLASSVLGVNQALTGYISITRSTTGSAVYGTLKGALSEDKMTLTITASEKFDGTYVVMVSPGILTTDGSVISRYVQNMNLRDTTGPMYLGTDVDTYGYINTIKFSEEIDVSAMSIVAVATSCEIQTEIFLLDASNYELSEDKTALKIDLSGIDSSDDNKELQIGINGITDVVGNRTAPSILTVKVKTNTALRAPGTIVSVERTGIYDVKVTFDSPLFDAGYIIIGSEKIKGEVSADNDCVGVFHLSEKMLQLTGNQVVGVTGWYSYNAYGSVYSTVNKVVNFTAPTTAPYLVNMVLQTVDESGTAELVLEYDREVILSDIVGMIDVSHRATNGDITPMSVTYIGETSGKKVTLTMYNYTMSNSGTYTILLPNNFVSDNYNKYSTFTTFALSLTASVADGKLAKPTSVQQDTTNASVLLVKFASRVDEPTAVNVSNYVLGNYVNPVHAELIEQGQAGATVKLTFSEGSIPYDADYPLKISGVKGYNSTYAAMDAYETELYLMENVAPIYASSYFSADNEIVLTFFESTSLSGNPEFEAYYNGKNIAWFSYIGSGNTVRIFLSESVTRGTVMLVPTQTNSITDSSGNVANMSGVYNVSR